MIVRILGEGQYELPADALTHLHELDARLVQSATGNDEAAFREAFGALLDEVRQKGQELADEDLRGSEAILPPADSTLQEVRADFSGEGLIPD